jgi:hypothetical protein
VNVSQLLQSRIGLSTFRLFGDWFKFKLLCDLRSVGQFVLVSCPKWVGDQTLYFFHWHYFLSFSCRAPSLTRGRVCNLQCNDASSSYIATDGLSVSSSWCRTPHCFLSFSCRAPSLTRGRVYNLQCNDASSSYIATDGLPVSSFWCRVPSGAHDQILIFFVWQLLYFFSV